MEAQEPAPHEELKSNDQQLVNGDSAGENLEEEELELESSDETGNSTSEAEDLMYENGKSTVTPDNNVGRSFFVNGLSVGLGIGCITTFIIMWIVVFFSPQLPSGTTYENLLSIFVFPLVYLLAVGLIALTAGIVREYFTPRLKA